MPLTHALLAHKICHDVAVMMSARRAVITGLNWGWGTPFQEGSFTWLLAGALPSSLQGPLLSSGFLRVLTARQCLVSPEWVIEREWAAVLFLDTIFKVTHCYLPHSLIRKTWLGPTPCQGEKWSPPSSRNFKNLWIYFKATQHNFWKSVALCIQIDAALEGHPFHFFLSVDRSMAVI